MGCLLGISKVERRTVDLLSGNRNITNKLYCVNSLQQCLVSPGKKLYWRRDWTKVRKWRSAR